MDKSLEDVPASNADRRDWHKRRGADAAACSDFFGRTDAAEAANLFPVCLFFIIFTSPVLQTGQHPRMLDWDFSMSIASFISVPISFSLVFNSCSIGFNAFMAL